MVSSRELVVSLACNIQCGMITQEHAKEHGFKNADEMVKAGVIK